MQGLTERQALVLACIRSSIASRGYPPTLREIGAHIGIRSTNGVNDHLRALARKGYVTREAMQSRGLRLVGEPELEPAEAAPVPAALDGLVEIPLLFTIRAGRPLFSPDHILERRRVDPQLGGGRIDFALRVRGNAMVGAGIVADDVVYVRADLEARPGQLVVVLLADEASVRRVSLRPGYVCFEAAAPPVPPVLVRSADFKPALIAGVVVGVYRQLPALRGAA